MGDKTGSIDMQHSMYMYTRVHTHAQLSDVDQTLKMVDDITRHHFNI